MEERGVSLTVMSMSARAERRAMSRQASDPLGTRAAWGRVIPKASAMTWVVAAVPRNWQPPPGEPQERQAVSEADRTLEVTGAFSHGEDKRKKFDLR